MHFLDTNIVLRLLNTAAPEHEVVRRSLEKLESSGEQLAIGLQVLVESWVVLTRPAENNGFGWSTAEAHAALSATRTRFTLLVDDENTATHWLGPGLDGRFDHRRVLHAQPGFVLALELRETEIERSARDVDGDSPPGFPPRQRPRATGRAVCSAGPVGRR